MCGGVGVWVAGLGPLAEVRDVVEVPEAVLVFAGEHARLTWRRQRRRLGGELLVEVAHVFFAANRGDEGGGHLPLEQCVPVHVLEGKRSQMLIYISKPETVRIARKILKLFTFTESFSVLTVQTQDNSRLSLSFHLIYIHF